MSKVLNLSLTDARYSLLAEIAELYGGTVYDVVRMAIDRYLFEAKGFSDERQLR